jgi:hypothetical protein
MLSTPARLMVRPFRGYAELAQSNEGHGAPTVVVGVTRFLFVFGAFVSLTATGRLAPFELGSAMLSFGYVPVVQAVALGVATQLVAREVRIGRAVALYAEGYGPWFLLMLLVAGGSLLAPAPASLLATAGGVLMLGAIVWSGVLTFACFRSGLGLSRRKSVLATAVHHLMVTGLVLGYFLIAGQLWPILPR